MPLVEATQTYESKKFRWLQCFGACCICGSPLRLPARSKKNNTTDSSTFEDPSEASSSSEEEFADSLDDVTNDLAYDKDVTSTWFFNQVRDPVGTLYSSQGIDMMPQEGHLIEASILFGDRSKKQVKDQKTTFQESVNKASKFLYDFELEDKGACLKHYLNMIKDADNYTVFICKECNTTMTNASVQFITMTHRIYFLQKSWLDPKKVSLRKKEGRSINDNILSIMTFFHLTVKSQNGELVHVNDSNKHPEVSMSLLSINQFDFDELTREMNHLSITEDSDDYLKNPPDLFDSDMIDTSDASLMSLPVVLTPTSPRQIWKTFSASRTIAHLMAWAEKKTWRQRLVSIFWAAVYIYHTLEYEEMVTLESWYVGVFRPFYDMHYEKNSWFGYLSETAYSSLLPFSYNHGNTKNRQSRQWIYDFLEDKVAPRMKPYNDYFFDMKELPDDLGEDMCTIQELNRAVDRLFSECSTISDIYSFYYKKLGVAGLNAMTNWCITNCSTDRQFTSRIKNALQKIVVFYKLNNRRVSSKKNKKIQ